MKYTFYFLLILALASCANNTKIEKQTNLKFNFKNNKAVVYTTAENTDLKITLTDSLTFNNEPQPVEQEVFVFVNPEKQFQKFIGIGGAITDASAEVFAKLSNENQDRFVESYFSLSNGIGYTLARTPIHSCDFSSASFTYIEEGDKELKTFDIAHDREYKIPLIKKVISETGGTLTLFASPWSPPAFMKSNNNMLQGGKLLPEFYNSWANYYTKFIKEYEKEGIPIWGISIQNEPMATQTWESCIYTAEEERDFLKNDLGPVMEKEGLGDKKIIVWDHNRDLLNHRVNTIFGDPEAAKYAWGTGFHWYESWSGGREMYENIGKAQEAFPDKKLMFTEGCAESFKEDGYQRWQNAERYGRSMINDFNYGTVGWTDWNILLDETGGPNHVGNFCFAPVHADTRTDELIYTPSYYYIGHFSKFIRPDAKRVSTVSSRSQLLSTSFLNTDGSMVTVVMNHTDNPVKYKLYLNSEAISLEILPHAIQTIVF